MIFGSFSIFISDNVKQISKGAEFLTIFLISDIINIIKCVRKGSVLYLAISARSLKKGTLISYGKLDLYYRNMSSLLFGS